MKFGFRKPRAIAPAVRLPESHSDAHGHPQNCLNCQAALVGAYCHQCGQSAHTHRYSIVSFLMHDMVHSFFHVEKNVFRTLWEVMIRPGITARKNVTGERIRYFPIITLLLLLASFYIVVMHNNVFEITEGKEKIAVGDWDITEIVQHSQKWILLGVAPLLAVSFWVVYRRPRYNYSEHLVIACHILACLLAWQSIFSLLPEAAPDWLFTLLSFIPLGLIIMAQWQAYGIQYKLVGFIWRLLVFGIIIVVLVVLIVTGVAVYAAQKGYLKTH